MVTKNLKQTGSVIPNYISILLMVSLGAWYALENSQTTLTGQKNELITAMKGQVMQRINALQSCYNDSRDWCNEGQLVDYGLSIDAVNNSFVVDQVVAGDDVQLTVQAPSAEIASAFSKHVMSPQLNGPQVTFLVKPPTQSDILKNQIQRYADIVHQRNSLASNVKMGDRDVKNFNVAQASKGEFKELKSNSQQTRMLEVNNKLLLGNNEIIFNSSGVTFDAARTNISGNTTVAGDLNLNNNSIDGVRTVESSEVLTNNLAASSGVVTTIKGQNVKYDNAKINSLSAYKYISKNYSTDQLQANSVNSSELNSNVQANSASINDLDFSSANGQDWNFNTGRTHQLTSGTSRLGMASGQNILLAGDMRGQGVNANLGQFTSASILGHTSGGEYNSNDDFTSSYSSVNSNLTSLVSQDDAIASNTSAINNTATKTALVTAVASNNTSSVAKNSNDINSNKFSINKNKDDVAINEVDIDKVGAGLNNSAGELGLWQDRLDECMYQTQYCIPQNPSLSLSCVDCSQADTQSSFSATALATISACRQGCTYSWVVTGPLSQSAGTCAGGTIPRGGSATPSCKVTKSNIKPQDIVTGSIKIEVNNSHYTDRRDSKTVAVSFKNTTIPRPTVSTLCAGCNSSRSSSAFNALVTSSISNCPQGCNYSWSISGGASGSCASGSVSVGGSASPSCSILGSVSDSSTMSGNVSIIVTNSVSSAYSDQDSQSYSWQNITPGDPFKNVVAGCYIDTHEFDRARHGGCLQTISKDTSAHWSVGDHLGREHFSFSNSVDWNVSSWSGDCNSSGSNWNVSVPHVGEHNLICSVTVEHIPTGKVRSFSVSAKIFNNK